MGIAVVRGAGSIGRRHAAVLASSREELGLDAVHLWPASRPVLDPPRGVQISTSLPDGPVDLFVVATNTSRHIDDAAEALAAGSAVVLVEKPLAARHDAAALAEGTSRVRVSAPLRFHRGYSLLSRSVAELGAVGAARIDCGSWLPSWRPGTDWRASYSARADEGGVLRDLVHELDYGLHLFGSATGVLAHLGRGSLDIAAEESADLVWRTTSGTTVSCRLDYLSRVPRRTVEVVGERGSLHWDVLAGTVSCWSLGSELLWQRAFPDDLDRDEPLARQARSALGRPRDDDDDVECTTWDEAVAALCLIDAARRSDAARSWTAVAGGVA